jgi:hypothetical protein
MRHFQETPRFELQTRFTIEKNCFADCDWFINDLVADMAYGQFATWGEAFRHIVACQTETEVQNETENAQIRINDPI